MEEEIIDEHFVSERNSAPEQKIIGENLIFEQRECEGFCGYTIKKITRKKAPDRCVRCGAKNGESNATISESIILVRSEAILHSDNVYVYMLENSSSGIKNYTAAGFEGAKREAYEFASKRAKDIAEKERLTLENLVD